MKFLLFFTLFTFDSLASSSRLILRARVLPKYTVTHSLNGDVSVSSNVVNNDSVKVRIEKKGKLFNCNIVQQ